MVLLLEARSPRPCSVNCSSCRDGMPPPQDGLPEILRTTKTTDRRTRNQGIPPVSTEHRCI
uniref:PXA1 n=1 Tax=Arundo donax TaxID=35708 RepID=A0A0A9DTH8_ARUDO